MPGHTDQQPLAVCTLPRSADKRARAQTRGQDVWLRRQAGRSWRRSKRQSAFYLQGCPTTHIAGRADTHPDALPPGSEGAIPSRPSPWSAPPSACASPSARIACVPSPAAGSYKSLRNRYVRLYMNAVESSILFLLDFGTICGVAQSEWNSQTWSLIDHRSVVCACIWLQTPGQPNPPGRQIPYYFPVLSDRGDSG